MTTVKPYLANKQSTIKKVEISPCQYRNVGSGCRRRRSLLRGRSLLSGRGFFLLTGNDRRLGLSGCRGLSIDAAVAERRRQPSMHVAN
uniref:Uncharacterized protein n=1 Tax=Romanomermis culicivorax TaxID=13658 RepID=A0A915KZL3_ROMCU